MNEWERLRHGIRTELYVKRSSGNHSREQHLLAHIDCGSLVSTHTIHGRESSHPSCRSPALGLHHNYPQSQESLVLTAKVKT